MNCMQNYLLFSFMQLSANSKFYNILCDRMVAISSPIFTVCPKRCPTGDFISKVMSSKKPKSCQIFGLLWYENLSPISFKNMAVVVAQLVEQSLPIPEVQGSNPVIGKIYIEHLLTVNCIEKTEIKKKEAGNGSLKNFQK